MLSLTVHHSGDSFEITNGETKEVIKIIVRKKKGQTRLHFEAPMKYQIKRIIQHQLGGKSDTKI